MYTRRRGHNARGGTPVDARATRGSPSESLRHARASLSLFVLRSDPEARESTSRGLFRGAFDGYAPLGEHLPPRGNAARYGVEAAPPAAPPSERVTRPSHGASHPRELHSHPPSTGLPSRPESRGVERSTSTVAARGAARGDRERPPPPMAWRYPPRNPCERWRFGGEIPRNPHGETKRARARSYPALRTKWRVLARVRAE